MNSRIAYLDGLRTLAIVAVVGVHWARVYLGITPGGYIGVDVFFVLSGYIVTAIIWKKRETRGYLEFLRGRVRRLYPALVGAVVASVAVSLLLPGVSAPATAKSGVLALGQVNTVVRGLNLTDTSPFGITWSLSAEWFFYILWPVALLGLRRFGAKPIMYAAAVVAVGLYLVTLPASFDWFYYGPVGRGGQMMAGAALALAVSAWAPGPRARQAFTAIGPLAFLTIVWWIYYGGLETEPGYRNIGFPLIVVATMAVIVAGIAAPKSGLMEILSGRWITAVGRAAYSIYLWHTVPVLVIFTIGEAWVMEWKWIFLVSFTAVAATLSYRFLEVPFLKPRQRRPAAAPEGLALVTQ